MPEITRTLRMSDHRRFRSVSLHLFFIALAAALLYSRLSESIALRASSLGAGDVLAPLTRVDLAAHDRNLLIVVRSGCKVAEDSMGFYRELAQLAAAGATRAGIAAILPDNETVSRNLLRIHGLDVPAVPGVALSSLKLHWTPTLVLADRRGVVLKLWEGQLSASAQAEVLSAIGVSQAR